MLATNIYGSDTGTPLLIVHGLFGSARNWGVIAKRLSETRRVITVDMRNHGQSFWSGTHSYGDLSQDLAKVIDAQGGAAEVLGHSMGGKAAMRLAIERPDMVKKLIVADIAPVAYDHSQSHLIKAMQALSLDEITTRGDADRQLSTQVESPQVRAFLLQSLNLKTEPPEWRLNLDVLDAQMDLITGWEHIKGNYKGPTLFLSGATSTYVQPEHRETIKGYFPTARFAKILGAGHWLHAEKPREFEAAVSAFLA